MRTPRPSSQATEQAKPEPQAAVGPLCPIHETLIDQRPQPFQHGDRVVPRHCRDGLQFEAADEDGQLGEETSCLRIEQVVAPGDCVAQRALSGRRVLRPAG